MTSLDHASFIRHMEKEHSPMRWTDVQSNINTVIQDVIRAATTRDDKPAFGAFTFDIMLKDTFQPVVMDIQSATDLSSLYKDDKQVINNLLSVMDGGFDSSKGLESFTLV